MFFVFHVLLLKATRWKGLFKNDECDVYSCARTPGLLSFRTFLPQLFILIWNIRLMIDDDRIMIWLSHIETWERGLWEYLDVEARAWSFSHFISLLLLVGPIRRQWSCRHVAGSQLKEPREQPGVRWLVHKHPVWFLKGGKVMYICSISPGKQSATFDMIQPYIHPYDVFAHGVDQLHVFRVDFRIQHVVLFGPPVLCRLKPGHRSRFCCWSCWSGCCYATPAVLRAKLPQWGHGYPKKKEGFKSVKFKINWESLVTKDAHP